MTVIQLSLLGRHVAHCLYPLSFQAAEHTLHRRVVVAIPRQLMLWRRQYRQSRWRTVGSHNGCFDPSEAADPRACSLDRARSLRSHVSIQWERYGVVWSSDLFIWRNGYPESLDHFKSNGVPDRQFQGLSANRNWCPRRLSNRSWRASSQR